MKPIRATIDFESYYDDQFSLRKMTPEEYIRDERFQLLGCAVQPEGKRSKYITGATEQEIIDKLRRIDWSNVFCLAHNNIGFDGLVLTERVGVRPAYWGCTLSMARQLHGGRGNSLADLAEKYGLQQKQSQILAEFKGKRLEDLTPEDQQRMAYYANGDAEICTGLFYLMMPKIHPRDIQMIHWFIRMFAEPRLELDGPAYRRWLEQMRDAKEQLLERLGVTQKELRSDAKFADLLRQYGIEPPTKISPRTGKTAFAFAKTDEAMADLTEHPNDYVAGLAQARIKTKTSIEETRAERFAGIASRGKLPVPLIYGATHTLRAAGAGKINLQNLGKGKPPDETTQPGSLIVTDAGLRTFRCVEEQADGSYLAYTNEGDSFPAGKTHKFNLRDGIKAAAGYKLVVIDSSNIELRVAHTIAGQMDTVEKLENGEDLYCWFASDLYGYEVKKGTHNAERQHGKVAMLQLQYQSGAFSFQRAARVMAGLEVSDEESQRTVDTYRGRFYKLPEFWKKCEKAIRCMHNGEERFVDQWGLVKTGKNKLVLPRGRVLEYRKLRKQYDEEWGGDQWVYEDRRTGATKKLYGGAMTENICQAIAGIIVMDQCVDIERYVMRRRDPMEGVVLTVHDEGVTMVQQDRADEVLQKGLDIMSTRPDWWPQIPLAAEGDIANRYGSAK